MRERTCLLLPLALLCTVAACGGGGNASAPSIRLSTTTITFADQQPGSISPGTDVTISNVGNAPLTISMVQLTGPEQQRLPRPIIAVRSLQEATVPSL